MQHDMMMRGLLSRTQDQYIRHVRRFAAYLGRPPDTATSEDLRGFQIHQHESGASAGTINGAVSALRFLYTVTLRADEFIRRFLLHVLPHGFHRIRHYGLLAGSARKASLALARKLLEVAADPEDTDPAEVDDFRPPCPCCGGRMIIAETFERWRQPRAPPPAAAPIRERTP